MLVYKKFDETYIIFDMHIKQNKKTIFGKVDICLMSLKELRYMISNDIRNISIVQEIMNMHSDYYSGFTFLHWADENSLCKEHRQLFHDRKEFLINKWLKDRNIDSNLNIRGSVFAERMTYNLYNQTSIDICFDVKLNKQTLELTKGTTSLRDKSLTQKRVRAKFLNAIARGIYDEELEHRIAVHLLMR